MTDGQELLRRRLEDRCIGCGSRDVALDPETGFVQRYCATCQPAETNGGGATLSGSPDEATAQKERPTLIDFWGLGDLAWTW